ncbi:hypothetical protein [Lentzea jiangxiensis]|uniref:Uncharacterized protein n=1 Tax=Lentzea jiangxiensis TaxID=641025 RepID=A0A1H0JRR9_9PSEU|nr:hypothetical protein SAMN05421507_102607 [Lentzea jiangxiensis]
MVVSGVVVVTGGGVVVTGAGEDDGDDGDDAVVDVTGDWLWLTDVDGAVRRAAAPVGSTG